MEKTMKKNLFTIKHDVIDDSVVVSSSLESMKASADEFHAWFEESGKGIYKK